MLSFAVMGFAFMGGIKRKRALQILALALLIGTVLLLSSCGGGGMSSIKTTSNTSNATPFTVTINGAAGTVQASTTVQVTVK
jgi:preprotein translocase subunit SecG